MVMQEDFAVDWGMNQETPDKMGYEVNICDNSRNINKT